MKEGAAIVSGGTGGIGSAVVERLQTDGIRVGVLDRRTSEGADASVQVDITNVGSVRAGVAELREELGTIDRVVCAAGIVSEATIDLLDPDEFRAVVDVSLMGTYLLCQATVPLLREGGGGSIVALSSGYARSGYRFGAHYAAAKAGVEGFVKSLAHEAAVDGIRVNAVAPGPVWTSMLDHIEDLESWRAQREAAIPLGRIGQPDDVAAPICFLLGNDARYVTGQVLQVNGGLLMA